MALLIYASSAMSADFGIVGNVFPIEEESFQLMIKRRLEKLNMDEFRRMIEAQINDAFNNPKRVEGVNKATRDREFVYDPTYFVEEDVISSGGMIFCKSGDQVNPLDFMDFNRKLYFIDATDRSQITWFKREVLKNIKRPRLILINGAPLDIADDVKMSVFYDQYGSLVKEFGIKNVPAMVWQEDGEKTLRVKEVAIQ